MKINQSKKLILGGLALIFGAAVSPAAQVNLVGNDGLGSSSYSTGVNWAGGAAPSSGNDYNTARIFMRTPGDNTTSDVFGGASLTLGAANGANGSMLEKFGGGSGSTRTLTINNFTNLSGAMIRSGGTAGAFVHITGNHYTIAGSSILNADQVIWVIDSPLLGGDSVILTNTANNGNDHVSFTGNNSGFTGSYYLTASGSSAYSLSLDGLNSLPGNPATFNPGQITFLGSGQLRDTVGCTFTNSNGGITLLANGNINASSTTLIGEPITDVTNGVHSVSILTSSGSGTLILSNANNNYSGGTTISAGTLRLGVANAIPGNTVGGDVTANAVLDLNGVNATINGLNGAGSVDIQSGGASTLTVGANGDNGTFTGVIQNSSGTLALTKIGAGTETLSGGYSYNGATVVAGGTLSLNTTAVLPSTPGDMVVSNSAVLALDVTSGNSLPVNNLVLGNSTNNLIYGNLNSNPVNPAINAAGGISALGSTIVINIAAVGLKPGTIPLIKYTGTPLASLANFIVSPPPGVAANLVNNTANHSIDLQITAIPSVLTWNGVNGTAWDLATANWANSGAGGISKFQQYTNNGLVAGDAVTFDDTVTNDFINPQPTNITLNSTFFAFPVVVNTTLPYKISGTGGIAGITSLAVSNSGSLTLLTSNSFTGGTIIAGSTLIITNDSALGASAGAIALNSATLQMNGNLTNSRVITMPVTSTIGASNGATVRLGGLISGASTLNTTGNGTLIFAGRNSYTGDLFIHGGTTVFDTGGSLTNGSYWDVGQNGADAATMILRGTAALATTSDFNLGDLDSSTGTLIITNSATLVANAIFIGSANAAGSTGSGTVNQAGGTVTEISTAVGSFSIGGRTSAAGVGVYNMSGGVATASAGIRVGGTGIGTLNQSGGQINALGGLNIARIAGSFGTNNLNGGILSTFNVASSTGTNSVFNFNGGTMLAGYNPPTPWMSGLQQANILAGGAIIDSSNFNVTISQPLLAGSANGGLTKKGSGTLNLTGVNTFTGPITNTAGTLFLNSASTYPGSVAVNAGTLQMTTASTIQGGTTIANGAVMSITQLGSATATVSNLTFNGAASGPGGILSLTPNSANNPAVALVNCGTLTVNGTNTISLAAANVGTLALIKYTGTIAGTGNCTNFALPQGGIGYISNNAASSTLYAVITSTGPGLVWTGTNSTALNIWDINASTNWLVSLVPTSYHQIISPGDAVTFNDIGNGTVTVNTNVSPASLVVSNSSKTYTFGGSGRISGPASLLKLGTGTATMNLTNNSYAGATVISNGTLQAGAAGVLPATGLNIGASGTFEVAGFNQTVGELTGAGVLDNNSGLDVLLTVGTSAGGTWNGSLQDHGHGAIALTKNGSGTWVIGGSNNLNNASPFTTTNEFNGGTTIITNGGSIFSSRLPTAIAFGGSTATMIVAGGTFSVSNDVLSVGFSTGANGTLIVNSGTVVHGGGPSGGFGGANNLIVGNGGGTGTLTVNGGQVLNSQALWLGQGATGSGTLHLNGGLIQATIVQPSAAPVTSIAYLNGGTLQATTNSGDFIQSTAMVQSGGAILDDGGFAVTIVSQTLQEDPASTGGGLIKKGAGTLYLDSGNSYTGTTIVTNGTLAGVGSIAGPVVVGPAGNIGAGDAGGIASFNLYSTLTLNGHATFRIDKTSGNPSSDLITGIATVNYGGTLTITNTTADATLLVAGDSFPLFSAGAHTGNFASIAGSPGTGLAYSFDPASGNLSVVTAPTIASNPTNITFSVSGSTLALSWPADHLGWILQSQTNSLATGLSTNWVDVAGSASVTATNIVINAQTPAAFFRLRAP